jgi:hypothetical protein
MLFAEFVVLWRRMDEGYANYLSCLCNTWQRHWRAGDPLLTIEREPAAGDDAVHMGVMGHRRAPGVQHQGGAGACPEMFAHLVPDAVRSWFSSMSDHSFRIMPFLSA